MPDLAAIYEAEVAFVWGSLRRLGVRAADLEDVTHDVFMAVQRRLADYDPARPIRPWLFGFAYRVASDYRRSARVQREVVDEPPDRPDEGPSAEERLDTREAYGVTLRALACLGLEGRAVLVLHDLEGCPVPVIAEAIGEPVNTIYSRLRLARERFAAAVRRIEAEATHG